ncbi:hypothetical protein P0W64_03525 [Tsukamurella sp. 8F]|uniref:hypothetical protein n=1 Tax=unclassified Tsukamurella TaxID=2633480 RepID=UPI0023B89B95|nr:MULTISPECIES: hypothetical protein [unclassified Tsukamurella]MDF0529470.1 hypothetical protein [Tsukamurella sp. 8J]MDF0585842.1 hypothetical protein [Tsukamurella sp. 8F]
MTVGPTVRRAVAATMLGAALVAGTAACGGDSQPSSAPATVSLPDGFPSGHVPLVEGSLIAASKRSQDGTDVYSVTVQADVNGFAAARKKLVDGGFAVSSEGDESGTRTLQVTGHGYFVSVTAVAPGSESNGVPNAVNYQVSKE